MKIKSRRLFMLSIGLIFLSKVCTAEKYGHFGIGLQRAIWSLWGPSVIVDANRYIGFESIVGILQFPKTNTDIGFFERLIIRPLTYKTNSIYLAGMAGVARWEYSYGDGYYFYQGKEWGIHWGAMTGIEIDTRLFFAKSIPIFINAEFGIEHRSTEITSDNTYPTYGFGIHYRF